MASQQKSKREVPLDADSELKDLQLKMLRAQQEIWHRKERVILVFEGFDASGKGGAIRRIVQPIDPRGVQVHAIGVPTQEDLTKHYLYRFWLKIPSPGSIAIFDRSWYGRVLVERVEKLIPPGRWRDAYQEINDFERTLCADGISIVKFFLAVNKDEQERRFEARKKDPYKRWKFKAEDKKANAKWDQYVEAADEMLRRTNTKHAPWHLIAADHKDQARLRILELLTKHLAIKTPGRD